MTGFTLDGWDCDMRGHMLTDGKPECVACGLVPEADPELERLPDAVDSFNYQLGKAMRQGQPGVCVRPLPLREQTDERRATIRRYHVLDPFSVESLRQGGTGGLAECEQCGKWIYVPGHTDGGIIIRGRGYGPGMNGVQL